MGRPNADAARSQPRPNSLVRRLSGGISWALLGSLASQAGVLAGSVLVSRLLGHMELYGRLGMVQSTVTALAGVAGVGLGATATMLVARYSATDPARAGRILGLCAAVTFSTGVLFTSALWCAAPLVAARYLHDPGLAHPLRLASLYVFFFTFNWYQIGAMAGIEAFASVARVSAAQAATALGLTCVLTWRLGLDGACLALSGTAFTSWLYYQRALRRESRRHDIRVDYLRGWEERAALSRFAAPAALSGMVGGVAIWWASALLTGARHGYSELGLYSAVLQLRIVVLQLPALVTRVASPVMCSLCGLGDLRRYRMVLAWSLALCGGAAAIVSVVLMLAGPPLLALFGREYRGPALLLGVMLGSGVLEVIAVGLYQVLYSHGRMWNQVIAVTLWSAVLVALAASLASRLGALGLAIAYLAAWTCSLTLYAAMAFRILSRDSVSRELAMADGGAAQCPASAS